MDVLERLRQAIGVRSSKPPHMSGEQAILADRLQRIELRQKAVGIRDEIRDDYQEADDERRRFPR